DSFNEISPLRFKSPLAPWSAAVCEGKHVGFEAALVATRRVCDNHATTIVEGVGGVAVPLKDGLMVCDFARELAVPVLIVASSELGTINHSILTITHLLSFR